MIIETAAGPTISDKVVQVDAANDLALLKADGRFAPLPIAASRTVNLGGPVATIGFPVTCHVSLVTVRLVAGTCHKL
ncbi:MAG: hypothetical protein ABSD57_07105 [Verrucomicrobiota bacterium]